MKSRRFYMLLLIASSLGLVLSLQLLCRSVVERFGLKLDLTENSLYEISDVARNVVNELNSEVSITIFSPEDEFIVMLKEFFKNYDLLGPMVSVRYIDPFENPLLVSEYLESGLVVKPKDIIVEGSGGHRQYSLDDMYVFNASRSEVTGLDAEQKITSAVIAVSGGNTLRVAVVDGHNERPSESLIDLFRRNNFRVDRGPLSRVLTGNPDLVLMASPGRDMTAEESGNLTEYLDRGGAMMLFLEPSTHPPAMIRELAAHRGIAFGSHIVFEREAFTGNTPINIVPMYSPHEINRYFIDKRVFLTMPSAMNLERNDSAGTEYLVEPVLHSTDKSYGKAGLQYRVLEKETGDAAGPFYLAMASSWPVGIEGETGRLFVAGSRKIYGDDLLGFDSYANAEFLVQVINWMSGSGSVVQIPPKDMARPPLNIQRTPALFFSILFSAVLPLLILGIGVFVFITKRRRG